MKNTVSKSRRGQNYTVDYKEENENVADNSCIYVNKVKGKGVQTNC